MFKDIRTLKKLKQAHSPAGRPAKYFQWSEVACKHCGYYPGADIRQTMWFQRMASLADHIRETLNYPLVASSWWRCPRHPIELAKGEPGAHTYGLAIDFLIHGSHVIEAMMACEDYGRKFPQYRNTFGFGLRQRGAHRTRFLHVDIAGCIHRWREIRPTVWTYNVLPDY